MLYLIFIPTWNFIKFLFWTPLLCIGYCIVYAVIFAFNFRLANDMVDFSEALEYHQETYQGLEIQVYKTYWHFCLEYPPIRQYYEQDNH